MSVGVKAYNDIIRVSGTNETILGDHEITSDGYLQILANDNLAIGGDEVHVWSVEGITFATDTINIETGATVNCGDIEFDGQMTVNATGSDSIAITAVGIGTSEGGHFTGGNTSGIGITVIGGAPNGAAISAEGSGTGNGGTFTGGSNGGHGLQSITTFGQGDGINTESNDGYGGYFLANGLHHDNVGVYARSIGGPALVAHSDTSSPEYAAFHLVPQDDFPTNPREGDHFYHSGNNKEYVYTSEGADSGWQALW